MTDIVENIGLEALMDRANIIFTNGYVFGGIADLNQLKKSFESVYNSVNKFKFQLQYMSQSDFFWLNTDQTTALINHQLSVDSHGLLLVHLNRFFEYFQQLRILEILNHQLQ